MDNELVSEQVRILAPIPTHGALQQVTTELYGYVESQRTDLLDTMGLLQNNTKTKKHLRRDDIHVSNDDRPYMGE